MIGIIAKLKVRPGMQKPFEEAANRLVAQSRLEAGSRGYTRWCTAEQEIYAFVEFYVDWAAAEAHLKSDHYRQIGKELGAFIDGKPEVIRLASATS